MYTSLVSIVMEIVNEEPVKDPKGIFRLCYKNVDIKCLNVVRIYGKISNIYIYGIVDN